MGVTQPKIWLRVEGCDGESNPSDFCRKQVLQDAARKAGTQKPTRDGRDTHMPTSPKPLATETTNSKCPNDFTFMSFFENVSVFDVVNTVVFCLYVVQKFVSSRAQAE